MRPPVALLVSLLAACAADPAPAPAPAPAAPRVVALSVPAARLVAALAPPGLGVETLLPPGTDPPDHQPSPAEIAALQADAALIVGIGPAYERWTATAALPRGRTVQLADAVRAPLTLPGLTHSHGEGGAHSHEGLDPHVWSSPVAAREMAEALVAPLSALPGVDAAAVAAAQARFAAETVALEAELQAAAAPLRGRPLASSHPAFGYLARDAGLTITAFGLDPGAAPAPAELAAVTRWAEAAGPGAVMLWEDEPSPAARGALPAALTQVYLDPLEGPAPDGSTDWVGAFRANLARLRALAPAADGAPAPPG
jgi:ABC-type Zn uptake system ZnuABC Zn-binding protein ZnuA